MAENNFIDAKKIVDELNASFNKHQQVIDEAASSLVILNKEYKKLPSEYIASQKEVARLNVLIEKSEQASISTKQKAIQLSETQRKVNEAIANNSAKAIQNSEKERIAVLKLQQEREKAVDRYNADEAKKNAASQKAAERAIKESGAYLQLSRAQAASATNVQNIIARGKLATQTQKQYNHELEVAQKDFDKLNQKVLLADRAVGRFNRNVGNYPMQAARGIKDLLGAFGVVGGATLIAAIAKDIYQTTKEIQSLDLALKQVTGTEAKFAQSQAFLSDISEKYGIEINGLTKQFTQFYVSAKDKISGKEIENIFESVAKSAGFMGLSVDAQQRAFIALNQMMSKGTVSAEELKGQLGEALPGAFGIMAKAMGTTEQGLAKLMKDGKVLSSEVLPKFAKELEKAYGIENKERVDSLAASQTRLSNSWTMFVRTLNESPTGGITQFFSTILDGANALLGTLGNLNKSLAMIRGEFKQHSSATTYDYLSDIKNEKERAEHAKLTQKDAIENLEHLNELLVMSQEEKKKLEAISWFSMTGDDKKQIKILQALIEDYNRSLGTQKGRLLGANQVLSELNAPKTDGTGDDPKPKKEHIKLNFDYIKSEYELKKAIIERQLAQVNDNLSNEEISLDSRMKYRKEFSEKSMELMLTELEMSKAINKEKLKDDKEKNDVAYKNKKITLQEYNQNVIDYNRDFNAKNGSADVAYSEKYRELINSDLEFYKNIEDEKREYVRKTNESILTFEKDKYKRITDNEDLTVAVRQKAFEEYRKLVRKEMDLNKVRELSASKSVEETNFIIEKYKELNTEFDRVNNEESPQALRMKELTKEAKEFIRTMSDGFLDKAGFGSLKMFTELDKEGMSTFDRLIKGAETTGEKMAVAFQAVGDVAQDVFSFIDQIQSDRYNNDLKRLESQKNIEIQFAGDSTTARAEIERQYEERRKAIERRKAEGELKKAKFNIIIDTAQAVVGALAEQNYAGAILYGLIGAAQLAVVSSQDIPAYAEGGIHGGGAMLVNDAKGSNYKETIVTPDGKISQPKGRNVLMNAPKGTEIYTPDQWQNQLNNLLLDNGILPSQVNLPSGNGLTMEQMETAMTNAIKKLPEPTGLDMSFDERGINVWKRENGKKRQSLNSRLRTKGRDV